MNAYSAGNRSMGKVVAKFLSLALVLAFSTLSCAGPRAKEKGAALGAVIGAATGTVVGAVIGHDGHASGEGAGVGMVFGGLIGALLGNALSNEEPVSEARQETPTPTAPPETRAETTPTPTEPEAKVETAPPPPAEPEVKAETASMPTEPTPSREPEERVAESEMAAAEEMQDIQFDFDRNNIRPDAQPILEANAKWIKENPDARIRIEGHCDERGTIEYNLALGEQRARSTRDYLISLGVDPKQLPIVSYGEERPLDPGHTGEAWAKNRRAHFAIIR